MNATFLRRFVFVTGALDYLVGAGTWAAAVADPQPDFFVPLMTLGAFLMLAAALLIWASKDMMARAPVIFWQGLVRATACGAVLYAVPNGLAQAGLYGLVAFDGSIAAVYIVGMVRLTGLSPLALLACRTPET